MCSLTGGTYKISTKILDLQSLTKCFMVMGVGGVTKLKLFAYSSQDFLIMCAFICLGADVSFLFIKPVTMTLFNLAICG